MVGFKNTGNSPKGNETSWIMDKYHLSTSSSRLDQQLLKKILYRMLRVGELLALVAFLSWSSSRVPSATAAALRLAGSLLLNARFIFVLGSSIVLLLLALSRHDLSASSSSSSGQQTSTTAAATPPQDACQQHPFYDYDYT